MSARGGAWSEGGLIPGGCLVLGESALGECLVGGMSAPGGAWSHGGVCSGGVPGPGWVPCSGGSAPGGGLGGVCCLVPGGVSGPEGGAWSWGVSAVCSRGGGRMVSGPRGYVPGGEPPGRLLECILVI